jgi:hypothetical protein
MLTTTHAFVVALATAVPAAVISVAAYAAAADKDGYSTDRLLRTAAHARPRHRRRGPGACMMTLLATAARHVLGRDVA